MSTVVITSCKEKVMFWLLFVCLFIIFCPFVGRITQKVMDDY